MNRAGQRMAAHDRSGPVLAPLPISTSGRQKIAVTGSRCCQMQGHTAPPSSTPPPCPLPGARQTTRVPDDVQSWAPFAESNGQELGADSCGAVLGRSVKIFSDNMTAGVLRSRNKAAGKSAVCSCAKDRDALMQ